MFKKERKLKDGLSSSEPSPDQTTQSAVLYGESKHNQTPPLPATATPAMSESEALTRDISAGVLNSFVGKTAELSGDMRFEGMVRFDGRFFGHVNSEGGTLIVSAGAQIDADIAVGIARIYGTVNGDIAATKRIEIMRVAKVIGDIQTPELVVEEGAILEGSCRMREWRSPKQAAKAAGVSA